MSFLCPRSSWCAQRMTEALTTALVWVTTGKWLSGTSLSWPMASRRWHAFEFLWFWHWNACNLPHVVQRQEFKAQACHSHGLEKKQIRARSLLSAPSSSHTVKEPLSREWCSPRWLGLLVPTKDQNNPHSLDVFLVSNFPLKQFSAVSRWQLEPTERPRFSVVYFFKWAIRQII